jgi:microcystin-dependent protein
VGIRGGGGFIVGEQRSFGCALPAGWLECNGTAVSRVTYAALFNAIGTTYGVGDGATTFNVPDKRGRGSIGKGQGSGLTNRTQGQRIGAETVTLSQTEMPVHTHSQNAHAHTQTLNGDATGTNSTGAQSVMGSMSPGSAGTRNADTATLGNTATNNNAGSGGAHSNMPPAEVDIWGIKF